MAEILRAIEAVERDLEEHISVFMEGAHKEVADLQKELLSIATSVRTYALKNRDLLTEGGTYKTVPARGAGVLRWYRTPVSVVVHDAERAIAELKARKLRSFIRVKEELNKQRLLEYRKTLQPIPGLGFSSKEKFSIEPTGTGTRVECTLPKGAWRMSRKKH